MLKIIRLVGLSIAVSMISGCSGDSGSEYIGKWRSTELKQGGINEFTVEKNGASYVVAMQDKKQIVKLPGTLKDNVLKAEGGWLTISFTHVKANDTLVGMGSEFKREK